MTAVAVVKIAAAWSQALWSLQMMPLARACLGVQTRAWHVMPAAVKAGMAGDVGQAIFVAVAAGCGLMKAWALMTGVRLWGPDCG